MSRTPMVDYEDAWAAVVAEYRESVRWQRRARAAEAALTDLVAQCDHERQGPLMDYELEKARAVLDALPKED